jgi:hypothetical protein
MKAAAFAYHRPGAVEEAVDLLAEYGDDAKILAGGQSLVPMLAMRLTHFENLVDISRIDELVGIDLCDGEVRIGAATRHAFVGMDDEVADSVPLLTLATPTSATFKSVPAARWEARSPTPIRRRSMPRWRWRSTRRWKRCLPAARAISRQTSSSPGCGKLHGIR